MYARRPFQSFKVRLWQKNFTATGIFDFSDDVLQASAECGAVVVAFLDHCAGQCVCAFEDFAHVHDVSPRDSRLR